MTVNRSIFGEKALPAVVGLFILFICSTLAVFGQRTVDKTIAIVSDASGSPQLITYSDVLWQLALEPGTKLDPPAQEDVARALDTLVKQRLFALEANRLPQAPPTEGEITAEVRDILSQFASSTEFESRLRTVGFDSVKDENFERLMAQRVRIKKYIDFRFRAFVVVTPEDEGRYFAESVLPEFKKRFPSAPEPKLSERRTQINRVLVERSLAESIEAFLDEAQRTAEIVYLNID